MKAKRVTGMLLASALAVSLFTGCGSGSGENEGGTKEFTAFYAVPGAEINDDNEIQQIIAEKTGVKVDETWLTGQTASEAVGTLIAGGDYPDFIDGGDAMGQLYEAGALVPLDDYLDDYPNIKAYYTDEEWNKLRRDDGHIYWIQQFQNVKGEEKATTHNDEAFWIQTRVLEWAGYPEVNTLDEYFDLLESYMEANPTMEDGTENIAYTILCEDWRYYCLENAPQFLDGYPNDGSVIVDPDELKVIDYNTTDTAKRYFQKLNEEYKKGYVDPESFSQTYDDSGEVIYDENGIKIVYQGVNSDDSIFGPEAVLYIENNTEQTITVQSRDTSVNGFMMDPAFSPEITPGNKIVSGMTFMSSDLEANNVTDFETIETSFHIFNENYDSVVDTEPITITVK